MNSKLLKIIGDYIIKYIKDISLYFGSVDECMPCSYFDYVSTNGTKQLNEDIMSLAEEIPFDGEEFKRNVIEDAKNYLRYDPFCETNLAIYFFNFSDTADEDIISYLLAHKSYLDNVLCFRDNSHGNDDFKVFDKEVFIRNIKIKFGLNIYTLKDYNNANGNYKEFRKLAERRGQIDTQIYYLWLEGTQVKKVDYIDLSYAMLKDEDNFTQILNDILNEKLN